MKARGVHLQYSFEDDGQRGAALHNPLFELLQAVHTHGSIQHAAKHLGASYRHIWGALKRWEATLGEPLVTWAQGQPARLTPFAERLLWAEKRARARLTPHIEALRAELERVLGEALDGSQHMLTILPAMTWPCRCCVIWPASAMACSSTCALPAVWTRWPPWPRAAAWWRVSTSRRCPAVHPSLLPP